jgi:hypothetical protein
MKFYNNKYNNQFKIGNDELKQTTKFCYVGSTASCDGGVMMIL